MDSQSVIREKHKKCPHLDKKIITHFNTFITNKKQFITHYIIANNDGIVQFGKNKTFQMALQANMAIKQFDKTSLIIGSFYDPLTELLFIWDQKSTIFQINYGNFSNAQRFQIKIKLQDKIILGMFSWIYKFQYFLFIVHQKGIQILSQKRNQIIKSLKTQLSILKITNKNIIGLIDAQSQPNSYLIAALVFENQRYPIILTKYHVQTMISQNSSKIVKELLQWCQNNYLEDDKYQKNVVTCLSITDKYLISGHSKGQLFIFQLIQDQSSPNNIYLQHIRTITEGNKIQSCDINESTQIVAISSNQSIMLMDIKKVKKIGKRLMQRIQKNLNVLKWTYNGGLLLAEENYKREGSLYLLNV